MEYNFTEIEKKWQAFWAANKTFKAEDNSAKPKYYVLDMFPYPSGAGLHVGHPLGYIASDIMARYKRHKGFNVLHPMGYDSFGLPAEQYAIQTGQHPAITTEQNINRYREQLDKIGFSFDWDREVRTSDPNYYKWTQWIFIQLFNSWYNKQSNKTEKIETLIAAFEKNGNKSIEAVCDEDVKSFSAEEWKSFSEKEKSDVLMAYRIAYLGEAYVNWCPALGTVLANDEVKDGVSERGGHPVERKLMKQWSMRITAYAQRLLDGLDNLDWTESLKETQRNWIGKSEGTSLKFSLIPNPSPKEKGTEAVPRWQTADRFVYDKLKEFARENKQPLTESEDKLWQELRNRKLEVKFRRQHPIATYIADFISLEENLIIEVDGEIHLSQKEKDEKRTQVLNELGFEVIRFSNQEILNSLDDVITKIKNRLASPLSLRRGAGGEAEYHIEVFTTRPDTVFGVSFVTLAPEHELVNKITTPEQKAVVDDYVTKAKNRSERERQAEVDKVSGVFTGAFVEHPFTGKPVPVWVGDYVLAGYGTGAVMAVPAHDERDFKFATHFGLPLPQVIEPTREHDFKKDAWGEKEGKVINSDFLNGLEVKAAIKKAIEEIEKRGLGKGKTNYRLRDAVFGRQRFWGEPIPIYYRNEIPYALNESELPLVLPEVDKYLPTEDGEPPLARAKNWMHTPLLGRGEGGEAYPLEKSTMPGWAGSSWYFLRYMDSKNNNEFVSKEKAKYWNNVDLYIGGSEHATGHLLYVRFWTKALKDLGYIDIEEPAQKLINQGMIQGVSQWVNEIRVHPEQIGETFNKDKVLRVIKNGETVLSINLNKDIDHLHIYSNYNYDKQKMKFEFYVPQNGKTYKAVDAPTRAKVFFTNETTVNSKVFSYHTLKEKWLKAEPEFRPIVITDFPIDAYWSFEKDKQQWLTFNDEVIPDQNYPLWVTQPEVEKMSKSKGNVITPDNSPNFIREELVNDYKFYFGDTLIEGIIIDGIMEKFGADTLRLYEMFLGPLELSKPWNTNGITGVSGFLKKLWRFAQGVLEAEKALSPLERAGSEAGSPTKAELKALHKTIKKITEDIERFSFNTSVSNFMICVNELSDLKCNKRAILEPLLVLISPYAPHITEELWSLLGHKQSIAFEKYPEFIAEHLVEDNFSYPISFNGKMRFNLELPLTLQVSEIEKIVLEHEQSQKYLEGKQPKKVIIVPKKIVNIVV